MSKSNSKLEMLELREKIINHGILPIVKLVFDKYDRIQSAMLLVGQYWDDEAHDAVHNQIIFSILPTPIPNLELEYSDDYDAINLEGLPSLDEIYNSIENLWEFEDEEYSWYDNGNAIPAFAAYCKEGCHQDMDYLEAYSPYAVFRRKEGSIEIEVVGEMLRPWLDGVLSGMGD
jgi:hypothetical protein